MPKSVLALFSALALSGCGVGAPEGAQVLLPERVEIAWHSSLNPAEDGVGALVLIDALVYEAGRGEPLPGVALELHPEGVRAVLDADRYPAGTAPEGPTEGVWDARQGAWYALEGGSASEPVVVVTDGDGLARFYLFADAFAPREGGGWYPASVVVSLGDEGYPLDLVPL